MNLGQITRIETVKQLKAIYKRIIDDETVNQQVRDIKVKERENKKSQGKTLDISSIDLFRREEYDTSLVCTHSFRSNGDIVNDKPNDLGNMASRYVNEYFHNSECAYICGLFSKNTPKCIEIAKISQKA